MRRTRAQSWVVAKILASALLTKFLTARDRAIAHYEMRGGKDGPELFKEGDRQCSLFVVSKGKSSDDVL